MESDRSFFLKSEILHAAKLSPVLWASLAFILTAPKTQSPIVGGPQINQYLCQYRQSSQRVEQIRNDRLPLRSSTAPYTKQVGLPFCLQAFAPIHNLVK